MGQELGKEYPKLKGFIQHGIHFLGVSGDQAAGSCPFCNKQKHFFVNITNQKWDCKKCGANGGFGKFLELRSKDYTKDLTSKLAIQLAKDRGVKVKTLRTCKVGWNGFAYTIPVEGPYGVSDIRLYQPGKKTMSTAGGKAGLLRVGGKGNIVWMCEGEWDTLILHEILKRRKKDDQVIGVPGAGNFPKTMSGFFQRKTIHIGFDNDEAGRKGDEKVRKVLEGVASEIKSIHWPPALPEGFDIRDLYAKEEKNSVKAYKILKNLLQDKPRTSIQTKGEEAEKEERPSGDGMEFEDIVEGYREWLKINDTEILSIFFGSIFANRLDGDPLWMFLVGPPGAMKTELLMSLNDAPLIVTTTSLTPPALISGMNVVGGDPSLIPKLDGKVLIVKDFTTILNMTIASRDEIFGILRDAYDGQCEKFFGNGVWRQYKSLFGIVGGVTPVIETFSNLSSVLGERFLKYRIKSKGKIDVGSDVIIKALENLNKETKMREDLRDVATAALNYEVENIPKVSRRIIEKIMRLSQWVACMRGVVSKEKYTGEVQFKPTAEIGTRLAKQLCKLGIGIAIVHRKEEIDEKVYQMIVSVARSTAPDRVEEIVRQLYLRSRNDYVNTQTVADWTKFPTSTILPLLQDLVLLSVVQKEPDNTKGYWKLSPSILKLMKPLEIYKREESWRKGVEDAKLEKARKRKIKRKR